MFLLLSCWCTASLGQSAARDAAAPPGEAREQSRHEFEQGGQALENGRAADALEHFERAYALFPHPATLYNIALAERALGRPVQTVAALERFLADAEPEAEQRQIAETLLREARAQRARLTVLVTPKDSTVQVDGARVNPASPGWVNPGRREVRVSAAGHVEQRREVELTPGDAEQLTVTLARQPPPKRVVAPPPFEATDGAFWGVTAATGALLAVGAVAGVVALGDASAHNDPNTPPDEASRRRSRGEVLRVVADVAFGLAVAGGVSAVVLASREPQGRAAATLQIRGALW